MPHLTIQLTKNAPIIDVFVGVSEPRKAALIKAGQAVPSLVPVRCLIDTGASCTVIDMAVINQLQLIPKGTVEIMTPSTGGGTHLCKQYDISLMLSHPKMNRTFRAQPIIGSELLNQNIHGLIGCDILAQCLFIHNGQDGHFVLSF